MLILGRRANQSIVFPNCGITVRILDVNGRVAKVGIDAPRNIPVMRGELATAVSAESPLGTDRQTLPSGNKQYDAPESTEGLLQLSQRLADIQASLHVFQQFRAAGDERKADEVLAEMLEGIARLDKDVLDDAEHRFRTCHGVTREIVSESRATYGCESKDGLSEVQILIIDSQNNPKGFVPSAGTFHGCQISTVNSPLAAHLAIQGSEPYDYIVCNCDPESEHNSDLVKAIRSNSYYDHTRIFVTCDSNGTLDQIKNASQRRIDGWLNRPLVSEDLWNHIVESNSIEF
jgi:carbon storage regulator CsrA